MACNCATNKQINELYRRYGNKEERSKFTASQKIAYYAQRAAIVLAMVPIVPFLFLYVLYKGICDDEHKISLKKFFGINRTVVLNGNK